MMHSKDLYQQQLEYIFGRPVSDPPWYHFWIPRKEEEVFGEDPLRTFEFIEKLCGQAQNDLAPYSDDQVAIGLEYIFCSGMVTGFKRADVPFKRREQALLGLFGLFCNVFGPRCFTQTTEHSKGSSLKLNSVCYLFWEECDLSNWLDPALKDEMILNQIEKMIQSGTSAGPCLEALISMRDGYLKSNVKSMTWEEMGVHIQQLYASMSAEQRGYYMAIVSVMEQCLALDNPVCVQSGLSGLEHLHPCLSDITVPVIERYYENRDS